MNTGSFSKRRQLVFGFAAAGLASFAACAPTPIGGSADGGAAPTAGTVAVGGDNATGGVSAGGSPSCGNLCGGWSGSTVIGHAGAPQTGTGGSSSTSMDGGTPVGEAGAVNAGGAPSGPVTCSTGVHESGSVNPCASPGEAGAGADCQSYDLVAAYWNGSLSSNCIEGVDHVRVETGEGVPRGMLADLHTWSSQQFVETRDGLRVGAIGMTVDQSNKLYVLDLTSGATTSVTVAHAYTLAGVASSGKFVGAYWTGSVEQVDLIDGTTGTTTPVGALGDLQWWSDQLVLDRQNHRVYALGSPTNTPASELYTLDLATGVSSSAPLAWAGFIGGVTATGQLVGANKDGSGWFVALIDPNTRTVTRKGSFGDLQGMGALVYDSTRGVAHTVGSNASGSAFLYNLDLATGIDTQAPTNLRYVLAKQ